MVRSARSPSAPSRAHRAQRASRTAGGTTTDGSRPRASTIFRPSSRSASAHRGGGRRDGVGLEERAATDERPRRDRVGVGHRLDLDGQAESVEELRAEVAFLRVHRADQDEPRGVGERQPLALDVVDTHRRRVQEEVDQVVGQQVDLVDVEHTLDGPVASGPDSLKARAPVARAALQVQAADDAVVGRADGQVHQRHRPADDPSLRRARRPAVDPPRRGFGGTGRPRRPSIVAGRDLGQRPGQRRALGRPLGSPDQDAAEPSQVDRREDQGPLSRPGPRSPRRGNDERLARSCVRPAPRGA